MAQTSLDPGAGTELRQQWEQVIIDVPLLIIDSPYRSFVAPVVAYIDAISKSEADPYVTVVPPEFRTRWPWQRWLHNQSARRLRAALPDRPNAAVWELPFHLVPSNAPD